MREIYFRGFQEREGGTQKVFVNGEWRKGEWVYGYPVIDTGDCSLKEEGKCLCPHDGTSIFFWEDDFHEYSPCKIIPETVGEYVGLPDKDDTKIFEGDIIEVTRYNIIKFLCRIYDIRYLPQEMSGSSVNSIKIIGNIYENPELLETKV